MKEGLPQKGGPNTFGKGFRKLFLGRLLWKATPVHPFKRGPGETQVLGSWEFTFTPKAFLPPNFGETLG